MRLNVVPIMIVILLLLSSCNGNDREETYPHENDSLPDQSSEEVLPFEVTDDTIVYKYDDDNLMGLVAIYVKNPSEVIYVFDSKINFVYYSTISGFNVHGINSQVKSFMINEYQFFEDGNRQYMLLKCDKEFDIDGFYLACTGGSHLQYELTKNSSPILTVYDRTKRVVPITIEISEQSYNVEKQAWDGVEKSTDVIQLEIYKD